MASLTTIIAKLVAARDELEEYRGRSRDTLIYMIEMALLEARDELANQKLRDAENNEQH